MKANAYTSCQIEKPIQEPACKYNANIEASSQVQSQFGCHLANVKANTDES
jgi:hypothetical protein